MWYAEKIELFKNRDNPDYKDSFELVDLHTLKINGEIIYNALRTTLRDSFETWVCDYCGEEGCNGASMLMLRRQNEALLFLPEFDIIDSFEEYDYDTCEGERDRPPHKWYKDGILVVQGDQLLKLYELIPTLEKQSIKEVTPEELDKIAEWEKLVIEKPETGFMSKCKIY